MDHTTELIRAGVLTDQVLAAYLRGVAKALRRGAFTPVEAAEELEAAAEAIRNSIARREELLP